MSTEFINIGFRDGIFLKGIIVPISSKDKKIFYCTVKITATHFNVTSPTGKTIQIPDKESRELEGILGKGFDVCRRLFDHNTMLSKDKEIIVAFTIQDMKKMLLLSEKILPLSS